jgi:hypothetical protein
MRFEDLVGLQGLLVCVESGVVVQGTASAHKGKNRAGGSISRGPIPLDGTQICEECVTMCRRATAVVRPQPCALLKLTR